MLEPRVALGCALSNSYASFVLSKKLWRENNRNEEEVEEKVEDEEEGIKTLRKGNNKNEEEVEEQEEDSIKTWRRENNKIVEEGIKKFRRGKVCWWLYIVPIHQAVLKKVDSRVDVGST